MAKAAAAAWQRKNQAGAALAKHLAKWHGGSGSGVRIMASGGNGVAASEMKKRSGMAAWRQIWRNNRRHQKSWRCKRRGGISARKRTRSVCDAQGALYALQHRHVAAALQPENAVRSASSRRYLHFSGIVRARQQRLSHQLAYAIGIARIISRRALRRQRIAAWRIGRGGDVKRRGGGGRGVGEKNVDEHRRNNGWTWRREKWAIWRRKWRQSGGERQRRKRRGGGVAAGGLAHLTYRCCLPSPRATAYLCCT
jgi:hypothetical protein